MTRLILWLSIVISSAGVGSIALAEQSEEQDPSQEEVYEEMLRLSDEATEAVLDGQFEIAAVRFRQAYRSYPEPVLLKNEMISWYRAGDCRSALPPARAFLQTDDVEPQDREDVATVELNCHLDLATAALDEENLILATYYLDILTTLANTARSLERYDAMRERLNAMLPPPEEIEVVVPAEEGLSRRDLGWIQVVGGLASIGTGAVIHGVALDRQQQLREFANSNDPAEIEIFRRREDEWGNFQRVSSWLVPTFYILGGVAAGSGAYFLVTSENQDRQITITPEASSSQVGFRLQGTF